MVSPLPPLKYGVIFSKIKKRFLWWTHFLGHKHYGETIVNGRTNNQIMTRWGRFGEDFHK